MGPQQLQHLIYRGRIQHYIQVNSFEVVRFIQGCCYDSVVFSRFKPHLCRIHSALFSLKHENLRIEKWID